MIKLFQIVIQTLFGWTVLTCGVPADDFMTRSPGGFIQIDYVCVVEVDGDKYGARGTFYRLKSNDKDPFITPNELQDKDKGDVS